MRFELLRDSLLRAFAEGCEVSWGTLEALRRQACDGVVVAETCQTVSLVLEELLDVVTKLPSVCRTA